MKSFFYGLFSILLMLGSVPAFAQIGIGTKTPAASAALEVSSTTNNKGILIPRLTGTQKDAIVSPAEGLMIFQTTAPAGFYYYTSSAWKLIISQTDLASGNAGTATKLASPRNINGVAFDGSADISIAAAASAEQLTGTTIKSTVTGSSLTSVGTLANLTVSNPIVGSITGNAATATTATTVTKNANLTGPVTSVGNATSITDGAITNAKITDVAATKITGNLPVANGGTGAATAAAARTSLELGNVDNTTDLLKPISTLTQNALDLKAPLASPTLTGTPLAPTATAGTNTTQIASTQFVTGAITTANAGVVPYTGATQAVDLGAHNLTVNGVSVGRGSGDISITSNTAIGASALSKNTTGSNNTANGVFALVNNTTGSNNSAQGIYALELNTIGSNNTSNGMYALLSNTTGSYNTAIGFNANVATGALSNATAIGNAAVVSASNTIQLGNTAVTNVNTSGAITAAGFTSTIATGTAPLVVTSTTPVANLSIGGNAATVTTNAILTGPVTSVGNATTITDGAITTSKIATGAVATASIADGAITNAKVTDVAASKITGTFSSATVNGKVIVGASSAASASAVLEASSTTQGFLPPRMTSGQRDAISAPVAGLVVWCSDCGSNGELQVHNGTAWKNMIGGTAAMAVDPSVLTVTNPTTGKVWMDRNLGASQVATSSTDALAYGDLYQWGRGKDGHQLRNSATTNTVSANDNPGDNFILDAGNSMMGNPGDWRDPQNINLWQGLSGTNNPCPGGYRVPTSAEWEAERVSWSSSGPDGAFASPLKLPMAGYRSGFNGTISGAGTRGDYWSSSIVTSSTNPSTQLFFYSAGSGTYGEQHSQGFSVRCIKN